MTKTAPDEDAAALAAKYRTMGENAGTTRPKSANKRANKLANETTRGTANKTTT